MDWITLSDIAQLETIDSASRQKPILIFKHSTRCSISSAALARLERAWSAADDAKHTTYLLDLIRYREVSNAIEERYGVQHGSPQTLVIRDGKCGTVSSHFGITYQDTLEGLDRAVNKTTGTP